MGNELVTRPEVLLWDEPTTGLDAASALEGSNHLKDIAATGVAVVCIMHLPGQGVFYRCGKLLLLSREWAAYFGSGLEVCAFILRRSKSRGLMA